jgi:hypothetical protein
MHYERLTDVPGIKKIQPERFVWHVTSKRNRQSILATGLDAQKSKHNAVCANNQSRNILFFYPFCINEYNGEFTPLMLTQYDYWRIDTTKVSADWYIDPNMKGGPSEFMGSDRNFVVTETSIPVEALTLYKIDMRYINKRSYVRAKTDYYEGYMFELYPSMDHVIFDRPIVGLSKNCKKWEFNGIYLEKGDGVVSVIADLPLVRHRSKQAKKHYKAA